MELTLKKRSIENRMKTINSALSLPLDENVYKKCIFMSNGIATYSNYNLERGEYLSLSYQGNLKNTKKIYV